LLHPPQNRRIGQGDATLGHHSDEIAGAELIRQIPPDAQDDDFLVKVPPFEEILCRGRFRHPSRYRKTPSVSTVCTRTVGELHVDENGLALRGVIVRHLVMPGLLDDTGKIVRWLAGELSPDTYVNVMDQYYPAWKAMTEAKFADINRGIHESEFEQALAYAREAGLWRLDRRWRRVRPRFEFVEIPPAG
jgi:hypothetical protein